MQRLFFFFFFWSSLPKILELHWSLVHISLAWPDPFRATAYRLEIISAALQGSGIVHVFKKIYNPQWLGSVNWLTRSLNRQSDLITEE